MNTNLMCDDTTQGDVPKRSYSQELVARLKAWDSLAELKDWEQLQPHSQAAIELVKRAATESSFLGYPRAVKLCNFVLAAMDLIVSSDAISAQQSKALVHALVLIKDTITGSNKVEMADSIDKLGDLLSHLGVPSDKASSPMRLDTNPIPKELTSGPGVTQVDTEHRDMQVYRNARLDSLDQCFEEESWIVSQLASLAEDLASGSHCAHPAGRLMYVLKNHKFFNQVDRVCIAGRVAGGNQLVILDASVSDRCPENALVKGYSCFVDPEGSLFKMKPGTVRVFSDCERVLSSFAAQGKPAQRSIALISDQGLRSGLCLALGRGSEIQGFLFMNSVQSDLFREITINSAPILSLFGLIATISLDTNGFHPLPKHHPKHQEFMPKSSTLFETDHFHALLEQALTQFHRPGIKQKLSVTNRIDNPKFLYLPNTIVNALAELIYRTQDTSLNVSIEIDIKGSMVEIGFPHRIDSKDHKGWDWLTRIVRTVDSEFMNKPVDVRMNESRIVVVFPFEPVLFGQAGLRYSIVC